MEPVHWLVIFIILCVFISFIANKKGRSGLLLFFSMVVPAVPLMMLASFSLENNMEAKPLAMWVVAFLCPVVGFIWAIMAKNKEQMAADTGSFGGMKKCQFCAEPVREEAIKCKHCGSKLDLGV